MQEKMDNQEHHGMTNPTLSRQPDHLQGRTIVIFGGTSGIGLAAAIQAKASGADVIVIGFERDSAERAAEEYGFKGWRVADVTKTDTIYKALENIPHIDHLVLLAGTFVTGKVLEADVQHLRRAFEERIWAAVHAIRAVGDRLSRDGSITFVSGALADRPTNYGTAILAAASAAMEAFARGLALEMAPVRVNTVSPGSIETPLMAKVLGEGKDAVVAAMKQALPLHRLGTASQAGAAVVFLISNDWMNGATLNVDGGSRLV
jgi:NAD(P)-dependent dehydrogenase (short-subunit alcohol dehydrogenase family)